MKLGARQLRKLEEEHDIPAITRRPLFLILDNIYDTYNIGGLFRLADALAMEKIYICGESEIPPNHRILKASIGTYKVVPWEYKETTLEAIKELRASTPEVEEEQRDGKTSGVKIRIVAIEQSEKAIPYTDFDFKLPLALVLGNETHGISQEILDACDAIVEIPMHGINTSLNVIVSAAIVGYHTLHTPGV